MLFVYAKYIKIMSNENKTIHDFELNLICDFFSNMNPNEKKDSAGLVRGSEFGGQMRRI